MALSKTKVITGHHRSTANINRRAVGFCLNVGGRSVDPDHKTADGEI
jgi:hypothetical protein